MLHVLIAISFPVLVYCCTPPLGYQLHGNKYFKYNGDKMSFDLANKSCREDDPGAHLAIFENKNDYQIALRYMEEDIRQVKNMWIGAHNPDKVYCLGKSQCNNTFYWIDGSKMDTSFLHHVQANGPSACVRLKDNHWIDDRLCSNKWTSLCQYRCGIHESTNTGCTEPQVNVVSLEDSHFPIYTTFVYTKSHPELDTVDGDKY